jgi:hypothetical protein
MVRYALSGVGIPNDRVLSGYSVYSLKQLIISRKSYLKAPNNGGTKIPFNRQKHMIRTLLPTKHIL